MNETAQHPDTAVQPDDIVYSRDGIPFLRPLPNPVPTDGGAGQATASMVLGILAVVFWWMPVVGLALAIPAVAFAVPGMRGRARYGQAVAGLVTGLVGLVGALFMTTAFLVSMLSAATAGSLYYKAKRRRGEGGKWLGGHVVLLSLGRGSR